MTNRERGLDRILHARPRPGIYGWEGSASDRVGINPAEGRPLSFDTDFTSVIDKIMVLSGDLIFTQRHANK